MKYALLILLFLPPCLLAGYDNLDEQAVANLTGGTYSPEAQRMDRLRRAMEIGEMDSSAEQSWACSEIVDEICRGQSVKISYLESWQINSFISPHNDWKWLEIIRIIRGWTSVNLMVGASSAQIKCRHMVENYSGKPDMLSGQTRLEFEEFLCAERLKRMPNWKMTKNGMMAE